MEKCPCGSGLDYDACCAGYISGKAVPATAEAVMRSRYSAYVKSELDYIFETTHPDARRDYDHKGTKEWADESEWLGLEVTETEAGGESDTEGYVEFIAKYRHKGLIRAHHERALFKKDEGKWYFKDGEAVAPRPVVSSKIGRNDPCTCGSGAKYKKCCGK